MSRAARGREAALRMILGALVISGALAVPAVAAAPSTPARLQGTFRMTGTVTRASEVPGEYAGERVLRTWTFMASCASGACDRATLVRSQGGGRNSRSLVLYRRSATLYTGTGSFWGKLLCGSRLYDAGEQVWYNVAVRITATAHRAGQTLARAASASYVSTTRVDHTPCVPVYDQGDAASYSGERTGG